MFLKACILLSGFVRTEYNSITYLKYYHYLNVKYEEQAKDKEKVKVLRIVYKTVSQTMGNQKQKEKRTGNTKRKSVELVIEV